MRSIVASCVVVVVVAVIGVAWVLESFAEPTTHQSREDSPAEETAGRSDTSADHRLEVANSSNTNGAEKGADETTSEKREHAGDSVPASLDTAKPAETKAPDVVENVAAPSRESNAGEAPAESKDAPQDQPACILNQDSPYENYEQIVPTNDDELLTLLRQSIAIVAGPTQYPQYLGPRSVLDSPHTITVSDPVKVSEIVNAATLSLTRSKNTEQSSPLPNLFFVLPGDCVVPTCIFRHHDAKTSDNLPTIFRVTMQGIAETEVHRLSHIGVDFELSQRLRDLVWPLIEEANSKARLKPAYAEAESASQLDALDPLYLRSLKLHNSQDLRSCRPSGDKYKGGVDPSIYASLSRFTALKTLNVWLPQDGRIDIAIVEHIAQLAALETLGISGVQKIEAGAIAKLASLKNLRRLVLNVDERLPSPINDDLCGEIEQLRSLTNLKLEYRHLDLTNEGLARLAGLPALETLTIYGAERVTGKGFGAFAGHGALAHVEISSGHPDKARPVEPAMCNDIFLHLSRIPHLRTIQVDSEAPALTGGADLDALAMLYKLELLDLNDCLNIPKDDIERFKKLLPKCEVISGAIE